MTSVHVRALGIAGDEGVCLEHASSSRSSPLEAYPWLCLCLINPPPTGVPPDILTQGMIKKQWTCRKYLPTKSKPLRPQNPILKFKYLKNPVDVCNTSQLLNPNKCHLNMSPRNNQSMWIECTNKKKLIISSYKNPTWCSAQKRSHKKPFPISKTHIQDRIPHKAHITNSVITDKRNQKTENCSTNQSGYPQSPRNSSAPDSPKPHSDSNSPKHPHRNSSGFSNSKHKQTEKALGKRRNRNQ